MAAWSQVRLEFYRKLLSLEFGVGYQQNSNGYTHVFEVAQIKYVIVDIEGCWPTPDIEMAVAKPEVVIAFQWKEITSKFQLPVLYPTSANIE